MIACDTVHAYMHHTTLPAHGEIGTYYTSPCLTHEIDLHHKNTRDNSPPKLVYIPMPKGLHPQLVTPKYGLFMHLTTNKDFLAN